MEATSVERQGTISVLGIPGSVSSRSFNVDLLGNAAREAPGDVLMTIYLEPGLWELPPFEPGMPRMLIVPCRSTLVASTRTRYPRSRGSNAARLPPRPRAQRCSRSASSVALRIRDTCICETPMRSPISR